MRKMKDSGIAWIGMVPEHWVYTRIGSLYGLRTEKVSDKDYQPLSVTKLGILPQLETVAKTNAHDDRKLVKKDDFAINSRSDRRGSCGISEYDGSVSLINTVLYPITEMNPQYHNWLFHTTEFADEFYRWGHGIVDDLWTTNWQDMKNIVIVQPPLSEQQRIANFLDTKCAEIDALTADIQSQIDTLEQYKRSLITETVTKGLNPDVEMKDSGVEWIGEIPIEWNPIKLKYYSYMKGRIGWQGLKADEFIDAGPYLVTGTDFEKGHVCWERSYHISEQRYNEAVSIQLRVGDLLVTKDGTIGKLAYIDELPGKASLNSHLLVIRPIREKYITRFLYWVLSSFVFQRYYELVSDGSTMNSLSQEKIGEFKFYAPKIDVQCHIADFLDSKCSEIDCIIETKQQQIDTLGEYKKSLIFEYVTGKKEVPAV